MKTRPSRLTARLSLSLTAMLAAPILVSAAPADDLAAVAQHLRRAQTMTAAFTQTDRKGQVLTGTVAIKQPGRLRFRYAPGVPITVVADGTRLYFVDYQVSQVTPWPIKNSPLATILDPSRDIARYVRITDSDDPRVVSAQAYDRRRPEYGRINLVFVRQAGAPGGLSLTGWVALDAQGNRTTVRLTDQRYDVPVGDEAFQWDDPRKQKRAR